MKKIPRNQKNPIEIEIRSRNCPFPKERLNQFVRDVLKAVQKKHFGINVFVIGSSEMKSLHWKYFKDRSDTDCISFSQFEGRPVGKEKILGDVFVSWDQIKKQAHQFGNTPQEELLYCIIHGILHLLGYDDVQAATRKKMFKLQDHIHKKISPKYT